MDRHLSPSSAAWSGPSVQCGRTCSVQIHRGSKGPSQISDISESQDELLVDAILAGRPSSPVEAQTVCFESGPGTKGFSSTAPLTTPPPSQASMWMCKDPSLTDLSCPTILLPLLGFTSWFPGRWHQPPRVLLTTCSVLPTVRSSRSRMARRSSALLRSAFQKLGWRSDLDQAGVVTIAQVWVECSSFQLRDSLSLRTYPKLIVNAQRVEFRRAADVDPLPWHSTTQMRWQPETTDLPSNCPKLAPVVGQLALGLTFG